jgi:hypothetical protein
MSKAGRNNVANALGGLLAGYGFVAFFCFLILVEHWAHMAPKQPDPSHGLVFAHNEHGAITYFSGFQSTSCAILFGSSIPLFFIGLLVSPKKNIVHRTGYLAVSATWDDNDPKKIRLTAQIFGAVAAPIIVFVFGPYIVHWLNGIGIVSGF